MTTHRVRYVAVLAAAALIFAACGGGGASVTSSAPSPTEAPATDDADGETPPVDPTSTPPPTTEPVAAPVCAVANELEEEAEVDGFDPVACDQPHDAEFAGLVAAPTGNAPTAPEEEAALLVEFCASSVQELVSRPMSELGIRVQYLSTASLGGPYEGEIECWAWAEAPEVLTASIAQSGLADAYGDYVVTRDLEPGTCWAQADDDSYNLGLVLDCTDDKAELVLGSFEADQGDYPGDDELLDQARTGCENVATDYNTAKDVTIDQSAIFLTYPDETGWAIFGERKVLCTVLMADVDPDGPGTNPSEPDLTGLDLIEIEAPEGFVFGVGEPICSIETDLETEGQKFYEAACTEPHNAELVALVEPPGPTLPADREEAVVFFNTLCRQPVEDVTGADLFRPGVSIGFFVPGALGEAYEGSIACFATFPSVTLTASFQDTAYSDILGDQVVIADLTPGECFLFPEDSFASGFVVECDTPDALMHVGTYEAADAPYPGTDLLRAERSERCPVVLADSGLAEAGLAGDPSTLSGSFPSANPWNVPGRRLVTCDIAPA